MVKEGKVIDERLLYVACPHCKVVRQKKGGKFNIIKRGFERNGFARFLCTSCGCWFNEKTGESMKWLQR